MSNWTWVTKIHRALYRASGGRVGARLGGIDMALLTTTGRRSGAPRAAPLACLRDGNDVVVVASNNGQHHHPAWWLNLESDPEARVQVGRESWRVRARRAEGEERARLWRRLVEFNPAYETYEAKTSRDIPVVILSPAGD